MLEIRSRRVDKNTTLYGFVCAEVNAVDAPLLYLDGFDAGLLESDASAARCLEQQHAQLLGTQPACAPCMQCCTDFFSQIREVLSDGSAAEQQVCTTGLIDEPL